MVDEEDILRSHYFKLHQKVIHSENWRNLPEIPSAEEITSMARIDGFSGKKQERWDEYQEDPVYDLKLATNIIKGAWPSKEEYVRSHYEILREDAVAPLRHAVAVFAKNTSMNEDELTHIYTDVSFTGYLLARSGAACRVQFCPGRVGKKINWKSSKRLVQGTVVALTPMSDGFQTICHIATVAARPIEGGLDQYPPTIDLFWADVSTIDVNPAKSRTLTINIAHTDDEQEYYMIEAREGYFEASRHMLVAMQKLMTEKFQLSEHLAKIDRAVEAPKYLEDNPYMNLTDVVLSNRSTDHVDTISDVLIVDVLEHFPMHITSGLDESQLRAFRAMVTKRLAIVHGPPGTGKTFVSICALKAMIRNLEPGAPPVIVSAQTNHALDQLLNHIMEFEPSILRLGGRSDKSNKDILLRTLFELRSTNEVPGGKFGLGTCRKEYQNMVQAIQRTLIPLTRKDLLSLEDLIRLDIITEGQADSLKGGSWGTVPTGMELYHWLNGEVVRIADVPRLAPDLPEEELDDDEGEQLQERLEIAKDISGPDDSTMEALHGTWIPFERTCTSKVANDLRGKKCRKLLALTDLYEIDHNDRGSLYRFIEEKVDAALLGELREEFRKYEAMVSQYQVVKGLNNIKLVRHLSIKIIGCTTTGLSKYRGFLSSLKPRTLLIEEAAETLEGYIIAGQFDSLDQLILVGDHQQLQASCNVKALETGPYHMNVSMFERLVINSLDYVMLNRQRRMIPEIRQLLCTENRPFYINLFDHEIVTDRVVSRRPIPGMGGIHSYFFSHNWPEARTSEGSSYNADEASMISGFYHYLTLNGVDASKITVLTFYNGQKKELLRKLKGNSGLEGISHFKVFTVDSYQGEENDVILLSLVRSNMHFRIGFLENRNRVVVALSRARRGCYMFGNALTLTAAETKDDMQGREQLWYPIVKHMINNSRLDINQGFPITCARHGRKLYVSTPDEWLSLAGGCDQKCDMGRLSCGHPCILCCHPFGHDEYMCQEDCHLTLKCGHLCSRLCGEVCYCGICEELKTMLQDPGIKDDRESSRDVRGLDVDRESIGSSPNLARDSSAPFQGSSHLDLSASLPTRSRQPLAASSRNTNIVADQRLEMHPVSSTHDWQTWDAGVSDEAANRSSRSSSQTENSSLPIINERHRCVDVKNRQRRVKRLKGEHLR